MTASKNITSNPKWDTVYKRYLFLEHCYKIWNKIELKKENKKN